MSPVREGAQFSQANPFLQQMVGTKASGKLRKGGWELVVPGKHHLTSYLKTNPLQTCLFLLYWKCCKYFSLHPSFLVQFKKYFWKKILLVFCTKAHWSAEIQALLQVLIQNSMNPTFFVSRLHDKLLFEGFLKTRSVLRMPTLGFPALLVTSRMSFTFPWALHTSSSSSLVQENGKPDIKSLCFSRVVLYLNTWRNKKDVSSQTSQKFQGFQSYTSKGIPDPKLPQSHE